MKWISAYCLTCIFLCATPSISIGGDAARAMEKADNLFSGGEFFAASIEYERAYFLSDKPVQKTLANLSKARALKQTGRYEKALTDLQRSLPFAGPDSLRFQVLYEMAFCSFMAGDHTGAASYVRQARYFYPGLGEGLWLLYALSLVQLEEWSRLGEFLEGLDPDDIPLQESRELIADIAARTSAEALPRSREPERARMMATFLPGLGHFYAGAPGKGILNASSQLTSLGVFGLLALNGYYVAGVTIGLSMFQSFYFGGIRQAGELARGTSLARMDAFKQELSQMLISLAGNDPAARTKTNSAN
jgi:tetratricopeptide (TPR) repeat protein